MRKTDTKQIRLALVIMGILMAGTEILTEYISKGAENISSIRFWFAAAIVGIYYVFALQISKPNKSSR